jgi:hypothetical protein
MSQEKEAIGIKLKALLAAWITIIFGTSALIYLVSPLNIKLYSENQVLNFFYATWEIADEVGPAVKLSLIALFTLLVSITEGLIKRRGKIMYWINAGLGVLATVAVLGLLPENYSRGFGIGLTGNRFDRQTILIYFIGSVLGGLVYTYSLRRQREQSA